MKNSSIQVMCVTYVKQQYVKYSALVEIIMFNMLTIVFNWIILNHVRTLNIGLILKFCKLEKPSRKSTCIVPCSFVIYATNGYFTLSMIKIHIWCANSKTKTTNPLLWISSVIQLYPKSNWLIQLSSEVYSKF